MVSITLRANGKISPFDTFSPTTISYVALLCLTVVEVKGDQSSPSSHEMDFFVLQILQKNTICPCHQDFLFEVWVERQLLLFVLGFFWWLSCFCNRFGCTCHTFMETSIQFLSMLKKITSGKKLHQWYSVYFKGYSKIQRTPSRDPKKKLAFWFWSSASISHQKFQQGQPCFNQVNREDKPGCLG